MPFYLRKSVSAGPFRFGFSKGGVGMSVGVRGLRVGTGPRGHYVQAGRDGFYYRAFLGQPRAKAARTPAPGCPSRTPARRHVAPDDMIEVTSGDVLAMKDAAFSDILAELSTKHRQPKMALVLGGFAALACAMIVLAAGPAALPIVLVAALAYAAGAWLDSFRRAAVLFYDVDDQIEGRFTEICRTFDGLAACAGAWHIEAGKAVEDLTTWKRQAGASHLVRRTATALNYALPPILKCNITPPSLQIGRRRLYFLPDFALVHDASGFGAVGYDALRIGSQPSSFIESGPVPRDAQVVGRTWQHPNKSGGPDRRFKQNRQLPICLYEAMHLTSPSGVNELIEVSRVGYAAPFASALKAMPKNPAVTATKLLA